MAMPHVEKTPIDQLQVQDQNQPPAQEPAAEPQLDIQPDVSDELLTPEETMDMLRGHSLDREIPQNDDEEQIDEDQQQVVGDFFQDLQNADPHNLTQPPEPQGGVPAAPAQPQTEPAPTPVPVQYGAPPAPEPAAPVQPDPQVQALLQQNQMLQQQLQQVMQQQQAAAPQPQPPAGGAEHPQPAGQQYNFNVPAQYMQALAGEDPAQAQQALNGLLNGVAQTVHDNLVREMENTRQSIPEVVQERLQLAEDTRRLNDDMYGTYPELQPYRAQVVAAAQAIAPALSPAQWTPDVRDAIAERVAPLVPGLYQKIQQQRTLRYAPPSQTVPPQGVQYAQPQQTAPPPTQTIPQGYVMPTGPVQGGHANPAQTIPQQQPIMVRDHNGQLMPVVQPPQAVQTNGARPGVQSQVDPAVQDIWDTLNV